MASVRSFGAVGDGIQDDSAAFQKALDGAGQILIPQGCYRIGKTLKIHGGTTIVAEPNARMVQDDSAAFQKALDGAGQILIPQGCYRIGKTLKIHGGTTIVAEPNARMVMDGSRRWSQGEFLLDNADHDRGNRDIRIIGGIWDGRPRPGKPGYPNHRRYLGRE